MTHFNITGKVKGLSNKVFFRNNLYIILTSAISIFLINLSMQLEVKKLISFVIADFLICFVYFTMLYCFMLNL